MRKSGLFAALASLALFLGAPSAHAGKVETVKQVFQSTCKKEIPEDQLMDVVIALYDCVPGTDVTVLGCTLKCLKENKGTVVGK